MEPMPPKAPAPQAGPAPEQGGGGSAIGQMFQMIPQAMGKLGQTLKAAGVPDQVLDKLKDIIMQFQQFEEEAAGGGGGKPQAGGAVPMEAGGGKAIPAM